MNSLFFWHFHPDFVVHHLSKVFKLLRVWPLFDRAAKGVTFQGEIKKRIEDQLFVDVMGLKVCPTSTVF